MAEDHTQHLHRPRFQWQFLLPRYWGIWIGLLFGLLFAFMPYSVRNAIGAGLGRLVPRFAKRGYRNAQVNLSLCFPDWDHNKRHQTIVTMYQRAAQVMLAYPSLLFRSARHLERHVRINNFELLAPYLDQGKPVILMVPHTWAIEFIGIYLTMRGYPTVGMMTPNKNPMGDWLICKMRLRYGGLLFTRSAGIKTLLKAIKGGHSAYYLPDQDHGMAKSEYVPFFATHKATLPGLGKMTASTGATVFPMLASYDPKTGVFEGHVRPALLDLPSGDKTYDARRMNQEIEALLEGRYEQYMWILKYLQSRPEGEPNPYRQPIS